MSKGQGKPGFCKICSHSAAQFLNARVEREGKDVFNAARASEFAKELDPKFTFSRQTWYAHLDHITHPLVTLADAARQTPAIVPKTTQAGLEMIRDIGLKRAVDNPDEVTVDHAIKAMGELNKRQMPIDDVLIVFAKVMAGEAPAETFVGEYVDVTDMKEDIA